MPLQLHKSPWCWQSHTWTGPPRGNFFLRGLYHTMILSKLSGPSQVVKRSSYLTGHPGEAGRRWPPASLIVHVCVCFWRVFQGLNPTLLHLGSILGAAHLLLLALLPLEKSNRGFGVTKGDSKHHRTVCSLITCFCDGMVPRGQPTSWWGQLRAHLENPRPRCVCTESPRREVQRATEQQRHWGDVKSWTQQCHPWQAQLSCHQAPCQPQKRVGSKNFSAVLNWWVRLRFGD